MAALIAIVWVLLLPEPRQPDLPQRPLVVAPSTPPMPAWSGPDPVRVAGRLADGSEYQPRAFLATGASVGLATSIDGSQRLVRVAGGEPTVLRRATTGTATRYDGFAVSADTLVWAESVARSDGTIRTMLWSVNWRTGSSPRQLTTTNTGEVSFAGGQYDIVIDQGRAYWIAVGTGTSPRTEVRSVALTGGRVSVRTVAGEFALTGWPWLVGVGGRGAAVTLLNLETDERISVPTGPDEVAACAARWCRIGVLGDGALVGLDLLHPDGSQRRRVVDAGATPAIVDVTLLDRFVPLALELGGDGDPAGGGAGGDAVGAALGVYDIERDRLELVTEDAVNVQGRDGVLWWATGSGSGLTWHALDLRTLR